MIMSIGHLKRNPDLDEPYLVALERFELEKGKGAGCPLK